MLNTASARRDAIAIAQKFAKHIVNGRFEKASEYCGEQEQKKMEKELKDLWEQSGVGLGKLRSFGEASAEEMGDRKLVTIPATFENGSVQMAILVDTDETVVWIKYQSLTVRGGGTSEATGEKADLDMRDVSFGKEPWVVKGKLALPKGKKSVPAVILVHGTGPRDADQTTGAYKPFENLAQGLASQGIAVLRFPNRTFAYKNKLSKAKTLSVGEEAIEDVVEALKFLRKQKGINKSKIYLLGIGFGAIAATEIAKEDKELAGVILLASSPRNFADYLETQLTYLASLPGKLGENNKKALDESRDLLAKLRDGSAPDDAMLLGQPISRWKEMNELATRTAKTLAELDCRVFIAGAGRDYQVTRADYDEYKNVLKDRPNVKFKWYKALNHYFVRGEGKSTPGEYEQPATIDPVVIEQLGKWVKAG